MTRILRPGLISSATVLLLAIAGGSSAQQIDEPLLKHFTWRSVGPAGAGGRIVDRKSVV